MSQLVKTRMDSVEYRFLNLYRIVKEREPYLADEAKIIQYGAILRYFMKFLQPKEKQHEKVMAVLYQVDLKLGDIYYEEALQGQDSGKYFLAAAYYNQALNHARYLDERRHVLFLLKDVYYYLEDEQALVKVEEAWAENQDKEDKFSAYVFLAQNASKPDVKAFFLEKALVEVADQKESFYIKYQDTLDLCSQLVAIYELLGKKDKVARIKALREDTLNLMN